MSEETAGGSFRFNVNVPPPSPFDLQDKNETTKAAASASGAAPSSAPSSSSSATIDEEFGEHGKFAFPGTQGKPGFNLSGNIEHISDGPRYLPIDSYGVIGNMKTAALVGIDGSIDWCCMPYFNSPSIFGRILDQNIGGFFQIRATEANQCKQHYWPDTNILVTRFMGKEGVGQLVDFMPVVKGDPMIPPDLKSNKFTPRSATSSSSGTPTPGPRNSLISNMCTVAKQKRGSSYHWIVRRLEAVHGKVCFVLNCFPAFNYARDDHTVHLAEDGRRAIFRSKDLTLVLESSHIEFEIVKCPHSGKFGVTQKFCLDENCAISFVLRIHKERKVKRRKTLAYLFKIGKELKPRSSLQERALHAWTPSESTSGLSIQIPQHEQKEAFEQEEHTDEEDLHYYSGDEPSADPKCKSKYDFGNYNIDLGDYADFDEDIEDALELHSLVDWLFMTTMKYWHGWIRKCTYDGRYREEIHRSALILKLMTFERTGAIVASITTSLPESLGENRNWDYRYTWIRDASFTLYAFLRIGFTEEAEQFMHFLEARCKEMDKHQKKTKNPKKPPLQVMYGIDGSHSLAEEELHHLEGYKGSRPVRIGNGAHDQLQLDVYGELLDSAYLYNKYATPISYDLWKYIRKIIDWVCDNWTAPDEGIWEVRGGKKHFLYSKVMCWVCVDRGIRLAERRSFPANRQKWLKVRDQIYEEVMKKGFNREIKAFTQYYGSKTLDASALILPLVFFVSPSDPRMLHTLNAITKSPKEGGLVSSSLVYRYDVNETDDGFTGIEEGTFNMCTFWLIEALTRAGRNDKKRLLEAQLMFEQMMTYSNHLKLFSEEMSFTGVALGNFPQAFTHLALISSAFNLNRYLNERG